MGAVRHLGQAHRGALGQQGSVAMEEQGIWAGVPMASMRQTLTAIAPSSHLDAPIRQRTRRQASADWFCQGLGALRQGCACVVGHEQCPVCNAHPLISIAGASPSGQKRFPLLDPLTEPRAPSLVQGSFLTDLRTEARPPSLGHEIRCWVPCTEGATPW